jgi:hypothetical protein
MKYTFLAAAAFLITIAAIGYCLMTTFTGLASLVTGCIVVGFACFGVFMLLDTKEMLERGQ